MRSPCLRVSVVLTGLLLLAACGGAAAPARRKPNVLILLADDLRPDAVGALGNPVVETPHLDGLVRGGLVFRSAYCLGSSVGAVCSPSRNMLLSGRAYFRFGREASGDPPNLPLSLRQAGYFTYHHGKRGNTAPAIQARFDVNKYVNDQAARMAGAPGKDIADDAVRFLRERRAGEDRRPFCMYLAFEAPHDPRVPAPEDRARYADRSIPLPPDYLPQHPFDNGEQTVRDELLAPFPRLPSEVRRHLRDYYAVITGLDRQIGRILAALRETGEDGNTVVVFASDNGLAVGSHGLMGKQSLYEHSMRVPLVVRGPGIRPGRTGALAYLMDLYPTLCELAGAPVPAGLDGKSLLPVLRGRAPGVRETLFTAYRDVQRSVRDARWKLIRYPQVDVTQLFDLETDPHETRSLDADPAHRQRIERMLADLRRSQAELGDTAPLTVPNPRDRRFVPPAGE